MQSGEKQMAQVASSPWPYSCRRSAAACRTASGLGACARDGHKVRNAARKRLRSVRPRGETSHTAARSLANSPAGPALRPQRPLHLLRPRQCASAAKSGGKRSQHRIQVVGLRHRSACSSAGTFLWKASRVTTHTTKMGAMRVKRPVVPRRTCNTEIPPQDQAASQAVRNGTATALFKEGSEAMASTSPPGLPRRRPRASSKVESPPQSTIAWITWETKNSPAAQPQSHVAMKMRMKSSDGPHAPHAGLDRLR
mmetsp:Transcript_67685/g.201282  ORF Transcript_67685/g.201282 Transcript_67685/m.201282 type:complete len:253 (+) Transcript_67685:541-1299(+)